MVPACPLFCQFDSENAGQCTESATLALKAALLYAKAVSGKHGELFRSVVTVSTESTQPVVLASALHTAARVVIWKLGRKVWEREGYSCWASPESIMAVGRRPYSHGDLSSVSAEHASANWELQVPSPLPQFETHCKLPVIFPQSSNSPSTVEGDAPTSRSSPGTTLPSYAKTTTAYHTEKQSMQKIAH